MSDSSPVNKCNFSALQVHMVTKSSTINDLEPQTLMEIFRLTGSHQCGQLATCQKLWRDIASDESLWQHWGHEDFAMEEPKAPSGQLLDSWRDPATEAELDDAERSLGFQIPDSLRVIYRVHNGQLSFLSEGYIADHGLFGGYSFYDHDTCTSFSPVAEAVDATIALRAQQSASNYVDGLLLGFGWWSTKSLILIDQGCQLRVGFTALAASWDAVPPGGNDAMLRWLEHYAGALHQRFACGPLRHDLLPSSICLYPVKSPWQRECVTRGVRVRAAAIFVPELSKPRNPCNPRNPRNPRNPHFFSYNVEISLLPLDEQRTNWSQRDGPSIASVQLQSCHLIMTNENGEVTSEREGVIGDFPILLPGGTPFVYQSCIRSLQSRSSMEGTFTLVEGTIKAPTGPLFDVQCPQFLLEKPDYVF